MRTLSAAKIRSGMTVRLDGADWAVRSKALVKGELHGIDGTTKLVDQVWLYLEGRPGQVELVSTDRVEVCDG
jgi:hypothetical protein